MAGGMASLDKVKFPASAPMSVGVKPLRVSPSKSSVTEATAMTLASAGLLACKCRSTADASPVGLTNSGSANPLAESCPVALRQACIMVWSALLYLPRTPPVPLT